MADPIQKGFLRLSKGSLGDTTFFKTKSGYKAREKKVTPTDQFYNEPGMARTRENAATFGHASTAASLIRSPLRHFKRPKDGKLFLNLRSLMNKVMQLDYQSRRGEQKVLNNNLDILIGFEVNSTVSFKSVFNTRFSTNAHRETGQVLINIPAFIPSKSIKAPKGTTHFTINAIASVIDFGERGKDITDTFASADLPLNDIATNDWRIELNVPPASSFPIFIFLGIKFTEDLMGIFSPVLQYKKDAMCIVNAIG